MKTPGLLYRISFLVILNSMFIFLAVSFVSMENNQAKIDKLVGYRYDFITKYFQAHIKGIVHEHENTADYMASDTGLASMFDHSLHYMKGLAGLTILEFDAATKSYAPTYNAFRPEDKQAVDILLPGMASELNYAEMTNIGIHVGDRVSIADAKYKTIYIPCEAGKSSPILAVTYAPEELVGSDIEYNATLVLLFLFITLISLLIVHVIFRDLIRPLNHVVLGMEKTAQGEVLYQIEDIKNDEIGRVTTAFNKMSASLWEQRRLLTASNEDLVEVNTQLTETLSQLEEVNDSLAKSESFLAKLITNAPFPIIVTNSKKQIITFSDAALRTFETAEPDVLGKNLEEFFPYAPDKVFPKPDERCKVSNAEMICRKTTGEHFPVLVSRVAIRDTDGTLRAYLFILKDITESRSFQDMIISIDRMATRGVMAGEIAHEINNYLAIILGNVELLPLLLSKGKMDKVDQKLAVLRQTVTKIQRFSEGLMGYGDDDAVFVAGDLNQVIENMIVFLRPQNRYDDIKWKTNFSSRLPLVEFDSSQLQQLLVNLFNNAADALRDIDRPKQISVSTDLTDNDHATITIADNADGLPDDIHEVIFRQRYTGMRRGRGFGLFIVKQIINKHAGTISYSSEQGKGCSFTITIPLKKVVETPIPSEAQVIS
ncbi:MAG: ATP-binding protein [Candidatus Zixiibacteriota bacterium]